MGGTIHDQPQQWPQKSLACRVYASSVGGTGMRIPPGVGSGSDRVGAVDLGAADLDPAIFGFLGYRKLIVNTPWS